ncbi:MAG: hypothetical protein HYU51_17945 [Candidatus Rokubacteria bacterium]|nr:hypothetical protein [Candidatus Rokubacteria bacterium]
MRRYAEVAGRLLAVFVLLGPLAAAENALAADPVEGIYRCASYNVSGGGGSCRTFQPLILQPDGTYQHSSTRGVWRVQDGRLHLSESRLWGPGEILGPDTVRFEYEYRGWRHTVTWVCAECAQRPTPRLPSTGPSASPGESFVGVSLSLEFGIPAGGVSSFVIVPADAAHRYTHNAPLPDGAVQGVAWETSATAVGLATGRNKLRTGRKYVVFLSWPRESIPVAVLDLPVVNDDYTTTLRATLDGHSVLASVRVSQGQPIPPSIEPPRRDAGPSSWAATPVPEAPPYPREAPQPGPPPQAASPAPEGAGGASGSADDFVGALRKLWRGVEELGRLNSKERDGGTWTSPPASPPPAPVPYPTAPVPYPTPAPAAGGPPGPYSPPYPADVSSAPSAQPADYPAPSGIPPSGVGSAGAGQPAAPRCHPLIPKYSQPGCVE